MLRRDPGGVETTPDAIGPPRRTKRRRQGRERQQKGVYEGGGPQEVMADPLTGPCWTLKPETATSSQEAIV